MGRTLFKTTATSNDGKILRSESFSTVEHTINYYITPSDQGLSYILSDLQEYKRNLAGHAPIEGVFTQPGSGPTMVAQIASSITIADAKCGNGCLESTQNGYENHYDRLVSTTTTRGAATSSTTNYQYDNWGNQTYILNDRFSNSIEQKSEQWIWYFNTSSTAPGNWSASAESESECRERKQPIRV